MVFCLEVDLFDSASLDKAFLRPLVVEHKVAPWIHSPQTQYGPSNARPSTYPTSPASSYTPNNAPWCTFHKTNSHSSVDCQELKIFYNMSLFAEAAQSYMLDHPEVYPSLILMIANEPNTSNVLLFTHNF